MFRNSTKQIVLVMLDGDAEDYQQRLRLDHTKAIYIPVSRGSFVGDDFPIPLTYIGYKHFTDLGRQLREDHG